MNSDRIQIVVSGQHTVSGLLRVPSRPKACYVLAHGAGAGMTHSFMEAMAAELAERDIATLRFQFPFMERGAKRPDPPRLAQETVRTAVESAANILPDVPLIAGGRSFGGRMASQAHVASELRGVRGLAFLGFPLHPAKKPSVERAQHLGGVSLQMLFIQGTRDALADLSLLQSVCEQLGQRACLYLIEGADHSFHVTARSGRTDAQVRGEIADAIAHWVKAAVSNAA